MNVYKNIAHLPVFKKAVVTIGTFDGVHLGHQRIIEQLKMEAEAIGGETVLITFDPHPRKIVSDKPLQLINTLAEKIELLEKHGIDHMIIVPFTADFASQTAMAYVEDFLIGRFHPHTVIIGYDHRFGSNRNGDFTLLEKYAATGVFKLIEIPGHFIDEMTISSTKIRESLLNGKPDEAFTFLGYDYFFEGSVIEGNKLGRTLGYPTANIEIVDKDKLMPATGVYAVTVTRKVKHTDTIFFYKGMMNIGIRPTIGGTKKVIEVNIFDFEETIYGETLRIHIKAYLRTEQKFNGLEALKQQLAKDKEDARKFF